MTAVPSAGGEMTCRFRTPVLYAVGWAHGQMERRLVMKTVTRLAAAGIGVLAALTTSACSDPDPGPEPSPPVMEDPTPPDSNAEVEAPEATETEEPDPEPPAVGDVVDAGDIEQARELGADVYVSPTGDGTGVVIDPSEGTPEVIVRDVEAAPSAAQDTLAESGEAMAASVDLNDAIVESGSGAFMLTEAPHFLGSELVGIQFIVYPFGEFDGVEDYIAEITPRDSESQAIADAQPYMDANPGFTFIDATR